MGLDAELVEKRLASATSPRKPTERRPRTTFADISPPASATKSHSEGNIPQRLTSLRYFQTCLANIVDKYPNGHRDYVSSSADITRDQPYFKFQTPVFNNSFNTYKGKNKRRLPRKSLSFRETPKSSTEAPRVNFMIKADNMPGDHANKRHNMPQGKPVLLRLKRSTTMYEKMPTKVKTNILPTIPGMSAVNTRMSLMYDHAAAKQTKFIALHSALNVLKCGSVDVNGQAHRTLPVDDVKKLMDKYSISNEETAKRRTMLAEYEKYLQHFN